MRINCKNTVVRKAHYGIRHARGVVRPRTDRPLAVASMMSGMHKLRQHPDARRIATTQGETIATTTSAEHRAVSAGNGLRCLYAPFRCLYASSCSLGFSSRCLYLYTVVVSVFGLY